MTKEQLFKKLDKVDSDENILLLTHTDMDAAGVAIVCMQELKNLDIKYLSNNKMSQGILNNVRDNKETKRYDAIIIADISCNDKDAEEVDAIKKETGMKIVLLDHHLTANHLNKYDWAVVESGMLEDSNIASKYAAVNISDAHSSGASLTYDFLSYVKVVDRTGFLDEIIHLIAAYDTWDWHYLFNDNERYSKLDKLCDIYGLKIFVDEMHLRAVTAYTAFSLFDPTDLTLLNIHNNKVQSHLGYIKDYIKTGVLTLESGKQYKVAWCIASEYLTETFDYMQETYTDCDMYIINTGDGVSLRTAKEELNVGQLAKELYNGGGHPGAAGFPINYEVTHRYMEQVLKGKIEDNN